MPLERNSKPVMPPNKESLISFIESISHPTKDNPDPWIVPTRKQNQGTRDMVDLCKVIIKYYYNPLYFWFKFH